VQFPATATAVLLFVDAWFDVTTSSGRAQFLEALVLALLVEIPAALFSLYLALLGQPSVIRPGPPGIRASPWWRLPHAGGVGAPGIDRVVVEESRTAAASDR
jgi:hypothetical protein